MFLKHKQKELIQIKIAKLKLASKLRGAEDLGE